MRLARITAIALLSILMLSAVACGGNIQAPSGDLPTWNVGDTWTSRCFISGYEYTIVETVTGDQIYNGIDCYIVNIQVTGEEGSTGTEPMLTIIRAYDKTSFTAIGVETGHVLIANTSCNYSVEPYPLSVGKTWTITCNTTTTVLPIEEHQTTAETYSNTYMVEGAESITVPAGTFQCFKIVAYNSSSNAIINTRWVTDITGGYTVKETDDSGITTELVSYLLSP
ncbi:MAG: hypothetical protein WC455_03450 [Dehalococcoidia bacterium]|jgi:hypothetical protein